MKTKPKPAKAKPRSDLPQLVSYDKLVRLPELQMRAARNDEHVRDMVEALHSGRKLPPIKLYRLPDGRLVVVDGFHRLDAYDVVQAGMIPCVIERGTYFEALTAAAAANQEHLGLKRTNEDKRRAVECFLRGLAVAGQNWSDRQIALHVGVTHPFVHTIRKHVEEHSNDGQLVTVSSRVGADGRVRSLPSKHISLAKTTLPAAIRDIAPPCDPSFRKKMASAGVATTVEAYSRLRSGDNCGLAPNEADTVRDGIFLLALKTACAAVSPQFSRVQPECDSSLIAMCKWVATLADEKAVEQTIIKMRILRGEGPRPMPSNLVDAIDPKNGREALEIMAALAACTELLRGARRISFFEAIEGGHSNDGQLVTVSTSAEPPAESPTIDKTPPTLKNGPVDPLAQKHSGWPSDEVVVAAVLKHRLKKIEAYLGREKADFEIDSKEEAWMIARFTCQLASVKGFSVPVAGKLGLQGIRTVRDLLEKKDEDEDIITGAKLTLEACGCDGHQVRSCLDALETLFRLPSSSKARAA